MIRCPKTDQRVRLHYRPELRIWHHGKEATVVRAAAGPGPLNALVQLDSGALVVVPRGNLVPLTPKEVS